MAQQQFQKIKFRVVSSSSEEIDYPVQELLTQSPQSKGWQSARFCDFPQEITLQFMTPIRLKQVQFLSHQSKIPSKVEIYVYLPDPTLPYQNHDIKYKKLGYLSLDSNERTGYQARELKSVYVDAPCQFIKLMLHKQHINKYNLFNQIGLIALSCFGESLGGSGGPQKSMESKEHYNEIQFETQFDNATLDRLRQLEKAKENAIQSEDYEEAKRLKEAIDRLKQIGIQLRQLDERKAIAVQNEDFDSARVIKAEIERLRNAVAPEYLVQQQQANNVEMQNQQYLQQQQQQDFQQQQQYQQQQQFQNNPGFQQQQMQQQQMNQYNQEQEQMQNDPNNNMMHQNPQQQQQMNQQQQFQQEQDQFIQNQQQHLHQQKQQEQFEQEQQQINNNRSLHNAKDHDDRVIPAIKNSGRVDEDGGIVGSKNANPEDAEPLSVAAQKLAMPLIPVLGEEVCRQLFSKNWPNKQKGLEFLQQQCKNPNQLQSQDSNEQFTAIMGALNHTLGDRIASVSISAIQTFDQACTSYKQLQGPPRGDLATYVDNCLAILVEKIGDNQKRISEPAEQAFFAAGNNGMIQNAHIVTIVAKGNTLPKKLMNSLKHHVARLNLLQQFVLKYQINNKQVPLEPVIDYAVKQTQHANQDVRNAAIQLIVAIHKCIGDQKLRPHLQAIPQTQMEILEEEFSGNGGKSNNNKQVQGGKKEGVTTNISAGNKKQQASPPKQRGGGNTDKGGNKSKKLQQEEVDCEFCHKSDPSFADSNQIDIHMYQYCPMLHNCEYCAQVVEISTLGSHLLEECKAKRQFRKCPRCKEPVKLSEYEDHTQDMSCLQAKPITVANRCCLCHQDIPAGSSAWKQHLIEDGCPNNQKTVG